MTKVRNYTDKELLKRLASLDTFKGWPKGYFDVWVRSKADTPDRFDDKVYTFKYSGKSLPYFVMVCSGTSNAGVWGLTKYFTYNPQGCAVLKSDVIVYNSHFLGFHKGLYKAYVQSYSVPFPYYRDNNRNEKAEEIGKLYYDRIGANCHRAGVWSQLIGKWSLGCLVRNKRSEYNQWMKTLKGQKYLSVCILKEF